MKTTFKAFFILLTASGLYGQTYNGSDLTVEGSVVSVSQLNITDSGTITDIDIKITTSMSAYQAYEYLNLSLISPSGTSVKLIKKGSLKNDAYQMILTDETLQGISDGSPPYSKNTRPDNPLYHFDGESISGNWELVVSNLQGFNGTVQWSLSIMTDSSTPLSAPNFGTEYAGSQISIAGSSTTVGNLTIPGDITITDLNIKLTVSMSAYQGFEYIRLLLKSDQITYYPFTEKHFSGNMYKTIIDDEAIQKKSTSTDWSSPHIGSHQSPNSPLDSFDGLKASNSWELIVTNSQGFDGTLDWSLLVNSPLERPTVSISTSESSLTDTTLIPVTITFSEYVNDFEVSDISVSNGFFHEMFGTGTTYNGLISPTTLSGNISIDIAENVAISKANYGNQAATQFNIIYRKEIVAPAAPTGLTGTYGYKQVDLSWNKNSESDVAEYYIYRDQPGVLIDSTTASDTTATITGLTNGTEYSFRVKAIDQFGNISDYSNLISIRPRALLKVPSVYGKIDYAVAAATSGDTILIASGTYNSGIDNLGKHLTFASWYLTTGDTSYMSNTIYNKDIITHTNYNYNFIGFTIDGTGYNNCIQTSGGSTVTLKNMRIINASERGLFTNGTNIYIYRSIFSNNGGNGAQGAGVMIQNGSEFEVYDSKFINNKSSQGGALYISPTWLHETHFKIKRTKFINNVTDRGSGQGGAVYIAYGNVEFENVLFDGNKSYTIGGAVYIYNYSINSPNVTFNHVTFANNSAGVSGDQFGGAMSIGTSAKIEIKNSIIWGNKGTDIISGYKQGLDNISYSLLQDGVTDFNTATGTGILTSDPRFLDPDASNYTLSNYSPAIGAGVSSSITDDITGENRPNPSGTNPDLGAYESALANKNTKPQIVLDTIFEGTELYIGRSYPISWKKYDDQSTDYLKVDISYSNDSGTTWESSQSDISSNYISWEVPNSPSESKAGQIRLIVEDADQEQDTVFIKDLTFLINYPKFSITSPISGISFKTIMKISDIVTIAWETEPDPEVENVDIYYSIDNGTNWKEIVKGNSDSGLFKWSIPNEPSRDVKLRLIVKEQYGYADTAEVQNLEIQIVYPTIISLEPSKEYIWSTVDTLTFGLNIIPDATTINKTNFS